MSMHAACEGFPTNCPNLIDASNVDSLTTTFVCGCKQIENTTRDMKDIAVLMSEVGQLIGSLAVTFQELADRVLGDEGSVVHACPPRGSGLMLCCHRSPLEVATTDRMTEDPADVTCGGARPVG